MSRDSSLSGKVALITGASGGIGSAIARTFARHGCSLALQYRSDRTQAARLAAELRAPGVRCETFQADLLKKGAPESLVGKALESLGRLDILVNNAGAVIGREHFSKLSGKDWELTMRLNATVPFVLSREAFKAMKGSGGRIINISSVAAKFGGSSRSMHYGAAKAALEALTSALAREGAAHGILANAIRAGVIDTPFHRKFPKDMKARVAMIPLGRMGMPEEVAALALFLAGPQAAFITGQVLAVTGGE